jgi:hypothetical protein
MTGLEQKLDRLLLADSATSMATREGLDPLDSNRSAMTVHGQPANPMPHTMIGETRRSLGPRRGLIPAPDLSEQP